MSRRGSMNKQGESSCVLGVGQNDRSILDLLDRSFRDDAVSEQYPSLDEMVQLLPGLRSSLTDTGRSW